MADYTEKLTDAKAMGFIDQVGDVFKGLPHLPSSIVDILVKIAPWLALLGGVLGLIAGPLIGILGSLGSIMTLSPYFMFVTIVTMVVTLANSILLLMAFSPLRQQMMRGWVFLFWAQLLSVVDIVLSLLQGQTASIVGGLIGLAIGFYILFEIRGSYKGSPKKAE
ncbi:hypothetical protein H3C66_02880 [Patescibacteria group bacterium]|nr:hypothetical protein [Patescibacteria group bacterium]